MTDTKELAAQLRKLATGRTEWRVQHPVEKSYCISFDRGSYLNPEHAARQWLECFRRQYPHHPHADYEVAEVRSFTALELAALDAAEVLDPSGVSHG
jgi:hypothetical protein